MKKNKRHYKFTNKKHSIEGLISTILSLMAVFLLTFGIYISFNHNGNGGVIVGIFGFLAFIVSLIGFFIGLQSFKKEEVFYLFSYIGTILNTIVWFVMLCVFLIGI